MNSVVLDNSLRQYFDDVFNSQAKGGPPMVVGFLVGMANEQKFQVVHAFKSLKPESAEEELTKVPPSKKEVKLSAKKLTEQIDEEWLNENGLQAMRSIPGGMRIVGLFAVVDPKLRLELQPILLKGIRLLYKTYERIASATGSPCYTGMTLLSIDLITKKPSASFVDTRGIATQNLIATYQDVKMIKLEWSIALISDLHMSSAKSDNSNQSAMFYSAFRFLFWQLENATITFDKQLKKPDEPLIPKSTGAGGKGGKKGAVTSKLTEATSAATSPTVDVYLHLVDPKAKPSVEVVIVDRLLKLRGCMACLAYVDQKATVAEAVRAVKEDMLKSLYFRIQLHCDGLGLIEGETSDTEALHLLPRRVFAPLRPSDEQSILIADYLFEGDSAEDAVQSLKEMFDLPMLTPEDIVDGKEVVLTMDQLAELNIYTPPGEEEVQPASVDITRKKSIGESSNENSRDNRTAARDGSSAVVYVAIGVLVALVGIVMFYATTSI